MNVSIGEAVLIERRRQHKSMKSLCAEAQISRKTLWRIEKGDKDIRIGTLTRVFEALGMQIRIIMRD